MISVYLLYRIFAENELLEHFASLTTILRKTKCGHTKTHKGTFYIVQRRSRFHIIYNNEDLGSYSTPEQAADDLSGGHTFTPSNGVDPIELEISDDLGDWEFTRSNVL